MNPEKVFLLQVQGVNEQEPGVDHKRHHHHDRRPAELARSEQPRFEEGVAPARLPGHEHNESSGGHDEERHHRYPPPHRVIRLAKGLPSTSAPPGCGPRAPS
jgi:hypothetical protein